LKEQIKKVLPVEAGGVFDCLDKICDAYTSEYSHNLHKIILRVHAEVKEITGAQSTGDFDSAFSPPGVIAIRTDE
jgi:hypothetical protein